MRDDADVDEEAAASERMWSIVSAMPGFISSTRTGYRASETFREYHFTRAGGYEPIPRKIFLKGARPGPLLSLR